MHKLIDYICDELEALERKAENTGSLSTSDIQYGDLLAHFKKNLLKAEEYADDMYSFGDGRSSYRIEGSYARGRGRNAKRDAMGRYSRRGYSMANEDMISSLHEIMAEAPDDKTRMEFEKFIRKIESM